jgi:nicotinamide mononucleotide transporter
MDVQQLSASLLSTLQNTSLIEWIIFATAMIYVVLAAIENKWCWVFGIISSFFSIYLCFKGKLFLESGLQIFYVLIGIYGWYEWQFGSSEKKALRITSIAFSKTLFLVFISTIVWIPFGYIAHTYSTQALPYLDAFITAFSIIATWMTAKKQLQNWIFWIVIDTAAIVLYAQREFYLIAILYFIYTILAVAGYFSWKKKIKN